MGRKTPSNRKRNTSLKLPMLLCLIGLCLLFRPVLMDWYATWSSSQVISEMMDSYEPLDDPELVALKENAQAYNARMGGVPYDTSIEVKDYWDQMLFRDINQMSWIDIPKIEVALPIYHGTGEDVLAAGAGHLQETSLPVGGESSHCVITGHSGMQGERMFDEIRYLEEGDTFVLHSLGEPYAYRVYEIETVWPHEQESLVIQPGRDLCTLITCTPYGINDHRLLVHAERCEYLPEMEPSLPPRISFWNTRTVIFFIGGIIVIIAMGTMLAIRRMRWKEERDAALRIAAFAAGSGQDVPSAAVRRPKAKAARNLLLPAALILFGLLLLSSSVLFDWYETWRSSQTISESTSIEDALSDEEKAELLEQAEIYNEVIAGDTRRYARMGEANLLPYTEQLRYHGEDMMSWVDIPKINTRLPIYHGVGDEALAAGAGHIEQTSLPVGGESANCAISAHSGMALTRMFDDIRQLEEGDTFVLWTLGTPYAYRVFEIETVLPNEYDSLKIKHGRDICTLITCTPYGINDHRLLVHGERCEYEPAMDTVPASAYFNYRTIPFLVGIAVALPVLVLLLRTYRNRKKALREEIEQMEREAISQLAGSPGEPAASNDSTTEPSTASISESSGDVFSATAGYGSK